MKKMKMTEAKMEAYRIYLMESEKSPSTIEKYLRDIRNFYQFLPEEKIIDREAVLLYKRQLIPKYQISSANSMIIAVNGFLSFMGLEELRVKVFKFQRAMVSDPEREIQREEYIRLVEEAERMGKSRLSLILQTLGATGIRISELVCITREAVSSGRAAVNLKGKTRVVILPKRLREKMEIYCRENQIYSGPVFVTRGGKPVDRSNIWSEMKILCKTAGINEKKIFPHNLRHLFARIYYKNNHDIVYLADILGHSSVEITRIYTSISGFEHEKVLEDMELII